MQSYGIRTLSVNSFDNVDLTTIRPVGPEKPKGRPSTADTTRHVGDIGYEEAVRVCFVAGKSDGVSAIAWICCSIVYSYVDLVVVCFDETGVLGCGLVDIVDKAMCRICLNYELEGAEEVGRVVSIHRIVRSKCVWVEMGKIASEEDCVCGASNTSKRDDHVLENA